MAKNLKRRADLDTKNSKDLALISEKILYQPHLHTSMGMIGRVTDTTATIIDVKCKILTVGRM